MEIRSVSRVLSVDTHRQIVQILAKKDMTAMEVFRTLADSGPAYRQTVHKALQKLRAAGLVSKYYDNARMEILYHLERSRISVDLRKMIVEE